MRRLLSLRGKMLLFTFGIVAVLTGLSLFVMRAFVARQVQSQIAIELARTQSVFESFMHERADWLRAQCEVVARDPRFTAPLDIRSPQFEVQVRTVLREARRFQHVIGGDLFMVTNRAGRVLARLAIAPLGADASGALAGRVATGMGDADPWVFEGHAFYLVSAMVDRGPLRGFRLVLGFSDDVDAAAVKADLIAWASDGERVRAADGETTRLLMDAFDCDLSAAIDADGQVTDALIRQVGYGDDLSSSPRIQAALAGSGSAGMQADSEQITQLVVTPVWVDDQVLGTLSVGFGVNDRLANNLRGMTDSEVSFGLNDRVVASTWPTAMRQALNGKLAREQSANAETPFRMMLGKETYLSLVRPLADLSGATKGFYLLQLSYDRAIAFLATAERVLLIIGASVLFVAAVLSFAGIGRITHPVEALVAGTRRVASGNLDARIAVTSNDEIGEMARAFNEMAAELQGSLDALTASERRYRDLFDNAQDMVYTTDVEMRLTSLNKAALAFLGRSEAELLGKQFYDLLTPDDARRLALEDQHRQPGMPRSTMELTLQCKDGVRALEVVSRWITSGGQPVGVHGIGRDIQERKEREDAARRFREQLHQAEKLRALGEMAAGVAHNFNNLLTGVMGYAELMKMRDDIPAPVRSNAEKIVAAAQRCSAIVRRIQTFGRPIDISQTKLIDLNAVIRDTVDLSRPRWKTAPEREGRKVIIVQNLGEIPQVRSTASAWEEILSNLIFNAVDAMPQGGTITLSTSVADDHVVVRVADSGTGMDAETRSRVFEPFFSTKGPERGTGLGLSTVWGLMQSLGGHIELDSAPGQGTQFTLKMPFGEGEDQAGLQSVEPVSGLRILAIDDDPDVRNFLPDLLKAHHVDTATSGDEGLSMLRRASYDVVMTDWVMTGLSGLDIAERVKRQSPQTVTLLMTGWAIKDSAVEGHPAVDVVVAKPFDAIALNRALTLASRMRKQG